MTGPAADAGPAADTIPVSTPRTSRALPAGSRARLPWRAAVLAALIVTLTRPASWAFGLAGFLAGGGLVLVAWPILVLPTPTGLQNALGGPVSTLVFGSPSPTLVLLILGASVAFVAAVLAGTWIGAWAEREGIALVLEAAADEGLAADPPDLTGGPGAGRIAVLRLLALVPPAAAMILAWQPIYDAAYHELILPSELVTPLPIRVIAAVPGPIVGVLVAWLVADAAAALGVRRMVLERRGILVGWLLGWADLVRRPHRAVGTALVGLAGLALVLAPVLLAAQTGWARVRELVADGRDPLLIVVAVLAWVALWLAGLVLAGVAAAFRAAAWTLEPPRRT